MKKTWIIIGLVAVILLLGLAIWYFQSPGVTKKEASNAVSGDTIIYTDSGFAPASLRIKVGTTVTVKNESSHDLQFSSDKHPTHTKEPELNTSKIGPGQSVTVTITKVGNWGYHNHLSPLKTGSIVVEQ